MNLRGGDGAESKKLLVGLNTLWFGCFFFCFLFCFFGFSSIKEDVEVRESLSGKQTRNEQAVVGYAGTPELHPEFYNCLPAS